MELSVKNKGKKKPQLIIQTGQGNPESKVFKRKPSYRNEVQIKPPMSVKNHHQLRTGFNFANILQTQINLVGRHETNIRNLQRLQDQKLDLMKSLQILKQGAVSAIVEKQQQILKLKQKIYTSSTQSQKNIQLHQDNHLNAKLYEKQLQLKQLYRKELEDQVEELRKQLRRERIRFQSELYEKESIINSLYVQLDQSFHRIQKLQLCDQLLIKKIKLMQNQNTSLLKQLETSQHLNSSQLSNSLFLNISNITQKSHKRVNSFTSQGFLFQQGHKSGEHSYTSYLPLKKYSEHMFSNEQEELSSNSFISQRIQSIKQKHIEQIQQIKQQYEQQIARLKRMYQRQPLDQGSQQKAMNRNDSAQSLSSFNRQQVEYEQNGNLLKYRRGSNSNLSRNSKSASVQSIHFNQRMQAIQQKDQSSGNTLKDQILEQELYPATFQVQIPNYDTTTTVSTSFHNYFNNKNSCQKNLNYETISQFTVNHFQYPQGQGKKRLFQRNSSIATFQGQSEYKTKVLKVNSVEQKLGSIINQTYKERLTPSKVILKKSFSKADLRFNTQSQLDDEDKKSLKSDQSNTSKSSIGKDIMLFCVGLVTGGTLFGLGSKMVNK